MRVAARVVGVILIAAYPIAVWAGISLAGHRAAALAVLVVLALGIPFRLRHRKTGSALGVVLPICALMLLMLVSIFLSNERFLLALPVFVNLGLLVGFGSTLMSGRTPAVERFARVIRPDLPPEQVAHCRAVTKAWCVFFLFNAALSLWLALFASLRAWGIYCGGIAYVLMGMMFAGEYAVRRIRFG